MNRYEELALLCYYEHVVSKVRNEQLGFMVFEQIAKNRMYKRYKRDLGSFNANVERLRSDSNLGESDPSLKFYQENWHFVRQFKQFRNNESHPNLTKIKLSTELVEEYTYKHVIEYLKNDLEVELPRDFEIFDSANRLKLAGWLDEKFSLKTKLDERELNAKSVDERVNERSVSRDLPPEKGSLIQKQKVILLVSLTFILLLFVIWYLIPTKPSEKQESENSKELIDRIPDEKPQAEKVIEQENNGQEQNQRKKNELKFGDGNTINGDIHVGDRK
jgi:hypothetical protein